MKSNVRRNTCNWHGGTCETINPHVHGPIRTPMPPYRPDHYLVQLAHDEDAGYIDSDRADEIERNYLNDRRRS